MKILNSKMYLQNKIKISNLIRQTSANDTRSSYKKPQCQNQNIATSFYFTIKKR